MMSLGPLDTSWLTETGTGTLDSTPASSFSGPGTWFWGVGWLRRAEGAHGCFRKLGVLKTGLRAPLKGLGVDIRQA